MNALAGAGLSQKQAAAEICLSVGAQPGLSQQAQKESGQGQQALRLQEEEYGQAQALARGSLHKRNTSPASSESYGQAMGAFRARQLSRRSTQYSTVPSSFDSLTTRRQMLQTGKSRGAPGKHGVFPQSASPRRSRFDARMNNRSRHNSRSRIRLTSPARGRPLSRSCRRGKARKRSLSFSSASPSRHKHALRTSKSTRKREVGLSWPMPGSPNKDLQHLSSSGRRRTGLILADTDFTGGQLGLPSTAGDCWCPLSPAAIKHSAGLTRLCMLAS